MAVASFEQFKDELAAIPRDETGKIWSRASNRLKALKGEYTLTSLRSTLTDERNGIREDERLGPDHPVLQYLRPSNADQVTVRAEQFEGVLERSARENRRSVDADDLVDTAMRLLAGDEDGSRLPVKTAALMLLTGRRAVELFRGELSLVGGTTSGIPGAEGATVLFTGQAKSRDDAEARVYEIPVLGEPAKIVKSFQDLRIQYPAIEQLQEAFPAATDRDINKKLDSKIASTLGRYVRTEFQDVQGEPLSPKDLRSAYATIAWSWFARDNGGPQPNFNEFTASILGHRDTDVGTALAYQGFHLKGESRTFDRAFRRANLLSAEAVDKMAAGEPDERRRIFMSDSALKFREAAGVGPEEQVPRIASGAILKTRQGNQLDWLEPEEKHQERGTNVAIADEAAIPTLEDAPAPALNEAPQSSVTSDAPQEKSQAAQEPPVAAPRNLVELVGTVESVTPAQRQGQPTRLEIAVSNGDFRDTIPVSAFREAGAQAQELEPGDRVAVEGYIGNFKSTRDGQTRSIAGVTANDISAASDVQPDRNYARVAGNITQEPTFRDGDRAFAAVSLALGGDKYADVVAYGPRAEEVRDTLGKGDGIAVEGRVAPREGRDGFPASVRVVGNEIELERKVEPKIELEGRLTKDPQVNEGPRATRVAFSIATTEEVDGEEKTAYRNIVSFDKSLAALKQGDEVSVTGRPESQTYTKDGEEKTFQYVRASSVERLEREQTQEQSSPEQSPTEGVGEATPVQQAADLGGELNGASQNGVAQDDVAPTVQVPSVNLDALSRQIARTDWDADGDGPPREGRSSVESTLESVARAGQLEPVATAELIDRVEERIGETRPEIVTALRAALEQGVEQDVAAPPPLDFSSLPVYTPGPNDFVDRREDFVVALDQTIEVKGVSEDGERVFGVDGGGVLSVSKDVFESVPTAGERLTISRGPDGKDRAESLEPEVALER
jgi:single-stranded DNA-binding protein